MMLKTHTKSLRQNISWTIYRNLTFSQICPWPIFGMNLCLVNLPHTTITSTHTKSTRPNKITNLLNVFIGKTMYPNTPPLELRERDNGRDWQHSSEEISKFLMKRLKNINGEEIEEATVVVEVSKALMKVGSQIWCAEQIGRLWGTWRLALWPCTCLCRPWWWLLQWSSLWVLVICVWEFESFWERDFI